jgi:hypothetical protein
LRSLIQRRCSTDFWGLTFGWLHVMPIEMSHLYKLFFFGIGFSE